ncbi:MAG: 4Fe-4S binding protein [Acidimicrobiaceae bacterium]|nr:4Fe-4S binding protein [Acidimicrobiaceae bacterium]
MTATHMDIQSSFDYVVSFDLSCTACGLCISTCPTHFLVQAPTHPGSSTTAACIGCFACIEVCPRDSVSVVSN